MHFWQQDLLRQPGENTAHTGVVDNIEGADEKVMGMKEIRAKGREGTSLLK